MKIEIESSNPKVPVSARVNVGGVNGQRTVVMMYVSFSYFFLAMNF